MLREALESPRPVSERVSIAFWMRGEWGGDIRHREIEAQELRELAENYSAPVRAALERLMAREPRTAAASSSGEGRPGPASPTRCAPWSARGRPGARRTSSWIPTNSSARRRVHARRAHLGGDDDDSWRLLILEDAGELITPDARSVAGQALSRLLNVADGLIGQGADAAADHDQRAGQAAPPGDPPSRTLPGRHRVHAALGRGGQRLAGRARSGTTG